MQYAAAPRSREVDEVDLYVGPLDLRPRARECSRVTGAHGERSAPEQQILQTDLGLPPDRKHVVVQRDRARAAPEGAAVEVILQRFAHARCIMHHWDAVPLEQGPRTDP